MKDSAVTGNRQAVLAMAALLAVNVSPVWAQSEVSMASMNHEAMPVKVDADMEMTEMDVSDVDMGDMEYSRDQGNNGMPHGSMQGGSAPADARDPHAYANGYGFGSIPRPRLADEYSFGSLLMNRLESVSGDDNTWTIYDLQAWYGRDYDRVVLKAEGDVDNSTLEEASTELLWGHAIATFWDMQLGLRYDSGEGPNRSWLAFGIQGLAPYWFELDVTAYLGENGRSALGFEAEYELLFTQKLILQPRFEAALYGKDDPERVLGSGLSDMTVGLRLRYEIRREFAPYLGVEWARKFGATEDLVQAAGKDADETRFVAGLRFWF